MTGTDAHDPIAAVRTLADELIQAIGCARYAVEHGRPIDLTDFNRQVSLLCAQSLDLPSEDGRRVRPSLIALSAELDALSRAIAARTPPDS
jgi:hypothetical protein